MNADPNRTDAVAKRTGSGARLIGLLVASLFLSVLAMEVTEPEASSLHTGVLLALLGVSFLGVLVAWRRERLGGLLLKLGAGASGVFAWARSGIPGLCEADLLALAPPLAALALMSWLMSMLSDWTNRLAG